MTSVLAPRRFGRDFLFGLLATAGSATALISPAPALGQAVGATDNPGQRPRDITAGATAIPEVVVTAERRSQRLQDVPISITALSANALANIDVSNVADLPQLASGLVTPVSLTGGVALSPFIRGIGTATAIAGFETSVAVYVDGVYSAAEDYSAGDIDLANIDRVEVLKGPQGTLYGRNATGGAINIITKHPSSQLGGDASISYGSYGETVEKGYLTGPLVGNLNGGLSIVARQGGDYGRDDYTGQRFGSLDSLSTNAQLAWKPSGRLDLLASFTYNESLQQGVDIQQTLPSGSVPLGAQFGGKYSYDPDSSDNDTNDFLDRRKYSAALHATYALDGVNLVSITAFSDGHAHNGLDGDGTSAPLEAINFKVRSQEITQELQAVSTGNSAFQWIVGAYAFSFHEDYDPFGIAAAPLDIAFHSRTAATGGSVFGQATYALTPSTKLTAGIRYSVEEKRLGISLVAPTLNNAVLTGPFSFSKTYSDPTWRFNIEQKVMPDVNAYLSYNRGFKSGGFNSLGADPNLKGVKPEVLDAYEAGVKSQFGHRRVELNAAIYYYDYKNIQVQSVTLGGSTAALLENAAAAKLYGLDGEFIVALTPQLRFNVGANLEHSTYSAFPNASGFSVNNGAVASAVIDETGRQVLGAPNLTYNVGADYKARIAGRGFISLSGNYSFNSRFLTSPGDGNYTSSYGLLNSSISLSDNSERYKFEVWGRNLTDVREVGEYTTAVLNSLAILRPRAIGVKISSKF